MKSTNGGVWIDREFKNEYDDSSKNGIRSKYSDKIPQSLRNEIKEFLTFIRKKYFFPIRINLFFCNTKNFLSYDRQHKVKGIFFKGDDETKKSPSAYIPCQITSNWNIIDIYSTIIRLLTYYFQWYFYEDEKRNSRSLEIEVTKYAHYIVYEYLEYKDKALQKQ